MCDLALVKRLTSRTETETRRFMVGALSELRDLGDVYNLAYLLLIYGAYLLYENHMDEGEGLLNESLRRAEALGADQHFYPYILIDLARAAHKRAAYGDTERFLRDALGRAKTKDKLAEATSLFLLGRLETTRASFDRAHGYFVQSLELALEAHDLLATCASLIFFAELVAAQGRPAQAAELLALVTQQDAVEKRDRDEADKLFAALEARLGPAEFAHALAQGKKLVLDEVVAQVLAGVYRQVGSPRASRSD